MQTLVQTDQAEGKLGLSYLHCERSSLLIPSPVATPPPAPKPALRDAGDSTLRRRGFQCPYRSIDQHGKTFTFMV